MESADGRAVVHCVEGGDLVDAHGRHFKEASNFIHYAYRGPAYLTLAEVEERHHGRFLVLRGIALEDFGYEFLIDGVEGEGD